MNFLIFKFMSLIIVFFSYLNAFAQYEDYQSYQSFTDLNRDQMDFGLVVSPSLIYVDVNENNEVPGQTSVDRKRSLLIYDMRMGYVFRGGFYFGLLFAGESIDINAKSPQSVRDSVGIGFGYLRYGWSLTGHFFPYSKQTLSGTSTMSEYSNGVGFQLDAAYFFRLSSFFSVGPQLVYKNIKYGEAEAITGNADFDANSNHSILTPMISLLFNLYRG